jgi:hypothetical protein
MSLNSLFVKYRKHQRTLIKTRGTELEARLKPRSWVLEGFPNVGCVYLKISYAFCMVNLGLNRSKTLSKHFEFVLSLYERHHDMEWKIDKVKWKEMPNNVGMLSILQTTQCKIVDVDHAHIYASRAFAFARYTFAVACSSIHVANYIYLLNAVFIFLVLVIFHASLYQSFQSYTGGGLQY